MATLTFNEIMDLMKIRKVKKKKKKKSNTFLPVPAPKHFRKLY